MRVRAGTLAVVLVCLVMTACGSGNDGAVETGQAGSESPTTTVAPETTTQPPPTTAAATTTSKAAAGTTSTTQASVLQRRDARPGGVEELGKPFVGGPPPQGADCVFGFDAPAGGGPAVIVAPKMVLGEATTICLAKFTGTANVAVQVKRADATTWTAQVSPKPRADEDLPSTVYNTMPGDPTGTYTVTATRGSLKATATFAVAYAVDQHILVVAESPGRGVASVARGKPVHIGLAGYKAGQKVDLSLHYTASTTSLDNAKFITLISATMDARGQRLYTLQTRADDPKGCYVVNTKPAEEPQGALGRLGPSIVTFCLS